MLQNGNKLQNFILLCFFKKNQKKRRFLEKVNTRQTKSKFWVVFFILLSLDKKRVFTPICVCVKM